MALPFHRFLYLYKLLADARRETVKERYTLAAFIGWQTGASGKKFGEYLSELGLAAKEAPVESTETAAEVITRVEAILAKASKKDEA